MEEMQEVELLQSEICLKIQTLQSLNSDVKVSNTYLWLKELNFCSKRTLYSEFLERAV